MRFTLYIALLVGGLGSVVGCKQDTVVDTDTDTDTDTDVVGDGFSPTVEEAIVFCLDSGQSAGISWVFEIQANDPQGAGTINSLNTIGAYTVVGDAEIFSKNLLACSEDGECIGSYREDQAGIICSDHENYVFRATIEDADGNQSIPTELIWSDSGGE